MAKRKGKPVNATQEDRHVSPRVVFHLPPELLSVIDGEAREGDRTRTAEILRALRSYYRALGKWPPGGKPRRDAAQDAAEGEGGDG